MEELRKPAWMQEPEIAAVAQIKLDFLQKMVFESQKLSPKELIPFLMTLSKRSKDASIQFTQEEMTAIIGAIQKHSTPEEMTKMQQLMRLLASRKP